MFNRRVRRPRSALLGFGLFGLLLSLPVVTGPTPPVLDSPSYLLIDPDTRDILCAHRIHDVRPPASITKIMTALLALEMDSPDDIVTVSRRADAEGGSSLRLAEGDQIRLADLTTAMMVRSGNDAAVAIAEHIGGTVENFCTLMNHRAEELRMQDTFFTNPNGMPDDRHLSTAFDLALLAREAMEHPEFREWVSTEEIHFDRFGSQEDVTFESTNHLLELFPLADGIKTGYTRAAGFCIVASATYRDRTLLAVVLGCERDTQWPQAIDLFDYGFSLQDPDYQAFRELYERGAIF